MSSIFSGLFIYIFNLTFVTLLGSNRCFAKLQLNLIYKKNRVENVDEQFPIGNSSFHPLKVVPLFIVVSRCVGVTDTFEKVYKHESAGLLLFNDVHA